MIKVSFAAQRPERNVPYALAVPVRAELLASVRDLGARGLLDSTVVVWGGEFGRTPKLNTIGGRDHWPQVGCGLLAGGGLRTGQIIGKTDRLGGQIVDATVIAARRPRLSKTEKDTIRGGGTPAAWSKARRAH